MERELEAFVERPCKETFLAARDAVLRRLPLPMVACDAAELERLLACRQFQSLLDRIDALPPSKVLSPRIHYLAAEAAAALGDVETVELERSLFVLTLRGLLATGDGTPANPYVVCHATDESDILAALEYEATSQSLVQHDRRWCDVVQCADGREIWFDVTDILIGAHLRPKKKRPRRRMSRLRPSRAHR